jgi:acyl carrier protein
MSRGDLPTTALRTRLAQVWSEVLGCGPAGETALLEGREDFFGLGGHSLSAVTAALRLSDELDVDIPARLLFDAPTIPTFADRVENLLQPETVPDDDTS